jgi:hypothetical protein
MKLGRAPSDGIQKLFRNRYEQNGPDVPFVAVSLANS